jgi:hypothetical protein
MKAAAAIPGSYRGAGSLEYGKGRNHMDGQTPANGGLDVAGITALGPAAVEAALAALLTAYAPKQDSADAVLSSLKAERARQDAENARSIIIQKLEKLLDGIEPALLDAIPAGKVARLQHVEAATDPNGKPIPAYIAFDVEFNGGLSTISSTRTGRGRNGGDPKSGKLVRVTLDGKAITGPTFKAVYLEAAKVLGVKPPTSNYSAHRELDSVVARFSGRVSYKLEEAAPATVPAQDAPPVAPATPAQ